jgi:hypothetical protein
MTVIGAKATAGWLLLLTLSPFTPPFSTCDLPTLLVGSALPADPAAAKSVTAPLPEASLSPVLPLARAAGRIRLLALFGPGASNTILDRPAAALAHAVTLAGVAAPLVLRSVLRI